MQHKALCTQILIQLISYLITNLLTVKLETNKNSFQIHLDLKVCIDLRLTMYYKQINRNFLLHLMLADFESNYVFFAITLFWLIDFEFRHGSVVNSMMPQFLHNNWYIYNSKVVILTIVPMVFT